MRDNYTLKRLYNEASLGYGQRIELSKYQAHYVAMVLRMREGDSLRLFNGRDGEWRAAIQTLSKKRVEVLLVEQLREVVIMPDVTLVFAPIRRHRTAFIFEKATELGVATFQPVVTERTQFPKLNLDKARMQIIEAAEQTERLNIPQLLDPCSLTDWLSHVENQTVLFADEAGEVPMACDVIQNTNGPVALLIGPEGGFSEAERDLLKAHHRVKALSLGPRILRADTAALSLLTLWQALKGDWN